VRIPVLGFGAIVEGGGESTASIKKSELAAEIARSGGVRAVAPAPGFGPGGSPGGMAPPVSGGTSAVFAGAGSIFDPTDNRYQFPANKLERLLESLSTSGFITSTVDEFVENKLDGAATARRAVLTFDGGVEAHYRLVMPLLERLRMRASFFVPVDRIDKPGGIGRVELEQMAKWGMGLGVLTPPAEALLKMLPLQLFHELLDPKKRLEDMIGRPIVSVAIPGRKLEQSSLTRTVAEKGYLGLVQSELGNHYAKDGLLIVSRYLTRRTADPEEWKAVARLSSLGPAKIAFFTKSLDAPRPPG
jgi:hypothetical protein